MDTKPFSEEMWGTFAGSESWTTDCPPLFSKGNFSDGREFVLVLDRTGCCLDFPKFVARGDRDAKINQGK